MSVQIFNDNRVPKVPAPVTYSVPHHVSHANYAFYDSPFQSAVVVSVDGGGDDGTFVLFTAARARGLQVALRSRHNWGLVWSAFKAVTKQQVSVLMNMGTLGTVQPNFTRNWISKRNHWTPVLKVVRASLGSAPSAEHRQNLLAHLQDAMTADVLQSVRRALESSPDPPPEGLVFCGGCAFNSVMVSAVGEQLRMPVYVPASPGDEGLGIGMLYVGLLPSNPPPLLYTGLPLPDLGLLPGLRARHRARRTAVAEVAALLADGRFVGVLRGRQETGVFPFGARAVLSLPNATDLALIFNLHNSTPFRIVVPCGAARRLLLGSGFAAAQSAPLAPRLHPALVRRYPQIVDGLGRGRVQCVTNESDPWLFALLHAVDAKTGFPVLTTNKFPAIEPVKHSPSATVYSAADALQRLADAKWLSHVLIDDWLFSSSEVRG